MPKRRTGKRTRAGENDSNATDPMSPLNSAPTTVLAGLQRSVASLADRINSLPRRFAASLASLSVEATQLTESLVLSAQEAAFEWGALASHAAKARECDAEQARVSAAQLEAYAVLLERDANDGHSQGVEAAARALLSPSADGEPDFVAIRWDTSSLMCAVELAVRQRHGIDPLRCIVTGDGLKVYQAGDVDNHVLIAAVDADGHVVESIEAEDVTASVSVEGAGMMRVAVGVAGVVKVVYRVPDCCAEPATLRLSVCGVALPGSPWAATPLLGDSAILTSVAPERRAAFLRELATKWLSRRDYTLLYRGSRDGMTAAAFHDLCDDKGPILVLIRCTEGWVFGGYSGASWEVPPSNDYVLVASPEAFLLSVLGPHSPGPVKFPVVNADEALYCSPDYGPCFYGGLYVMASRMSFCAIAEGADYENVLGLGDASLSGEARFTPSDIEVFAVTHADARASP